LGWLVMPEAMTAHMGKLIEFNTSCASSFVQRAGVVALQRADEVTPRVVAHLTACRDTLVAELQQLQGVELATPDGGMYAFFRLPGHTDDLQTAKRLVAEAGLGLAPGSAFAPEAQGWLRWCFASQDLSRLTLGAERLRGDMRALGRRCATVRATSRTTRWPISTSTSRSSSARSSASVGMSTGRRRPPMHGASSPNSARA
jgi:aspartate/methionine/tyrosine aminotransferase